MSIKILLLIMIIILMMIMMLLRDKTFSFSCRVDKLKECFCVRAERWSDQAAPTVISDICVCTACCPFPVFLLYFFIVFLCYFFWHFCLHCYVPFRSSISLHTMFTISKIVFKQCCQMHSCYTIHVFLLRDFYVCLCFMLLQICLNF